MSEASARDDEALVSGAEIARLAGVTRAAVSNWRKRYPDFPEPVGGGNRSTLFRLPEVQAWLKRQDKGVEVSAEVRVWQALRSEYGEDMLRGLADLASVLAGRAEPSILADRVDAAVRDLLAERSPADAVEGLVERFASAPARDGADQVTGNRLIKAIGSFARATEAEPATILDPACGIGSLLLSFGRKTRRRLVGQDMNRSAARLAAARAALAAFPDTAIQVGDTLRADRFPGLRADLVVCDPPVNVPAWGREDLLIDPRWEFGTPPRAESELAWLQHCFAHVAPGGRAIVVMPPSVAYRKAGRRIRSEIVRQGVLTDVVALPGGMVATHVQPVHLWLLARPGSGTTPAESVRMVDLTGADPDGPYEPTDRQVARIRLIDLLDDDIDLSPGRHVAASNVDFLADYRELRASVQAHLNRLDRLLPSLAPGPGQLDGAATSVADLAKAGLVDLTEDGAVSASDQLDTDYLRGFLQSAANVRRSTSGSGTFRLDARGSRIPNMDIDEQRRYGETFHALAEFERASGELARLGGRAAELARTGLTSGALRPSSEDTDQDTERRT
ncbi:N-6 DNA methylase [Actinomadura parmotrematis]|uniref:N-6 DNA methylase n=1 Tax=Actinomadura parmotrematis TaxID=2864039 RepID=A0ABS7FU60_9ACTN|nr:N-6 DNA methylase [Actinomadura parmotrematis]MBW8483943.1 N-6 DNA methylase [Actinomadura parmotrematis]